MTLDHFFRQAWRWSAGLPEDQPKPLRPSLEHLRRSQWNDTFETLMRNRLVMGAFRYGAFEEQRHTRRDNVPSILHHATLYQQTGNAEHLVDVANLALVEFTRPSHSNFHFESIDDGEHHTKLVRKLP